MGKATTKKKLRRRKATLITVSILLVTVIAVCVVFRDTLSLIISGEWHDSGLTEDPAVLSVHQTPNIGEEITNIVLFGVDAHDPKSFSGLSDTIIIASINSTTHAVKLISIMRDSFVEVPGHWDSKINSAYNMGGATLAIKTLNHNFKLDIEDYVTVNFANMAKIIDAVGGVDVDLSAEEITLLNKMLVPGGEINRPDLMFTANPGMRRLNGVLATLYARIRKTSDGKGDSGRVERQAEVISALKDRFLTLSYSELISMIPSLLSMVKTSMTYEDIIKFLPVAMADDLTLEQIKIPVDLPSGYSVQPSPWAYVYDTDAAASFIRMTIYDASGLESDIISER